MSYIRYDCNPFVVRLSWGNRTAAPQHTHNLHTHTMSSLPFAADNPAAPQGATGVATPAFSPLYQQIKGLILQSLQQGEWKPGEAIPSEMELAARFRVSQGTVRKAIDELAAENLVMRRQGKGTFVKAHGNELIKERARERIMQVLRQTVTAAKAADIELIDLLSMFEKAYREQS